MSEIKFSREEIVRLRDEEGYSFTQISKIVGAKNVGHIRTVYREYKADNSNRVDEGKIRALHNAGWCYEKIADECRVSVRVVADVIGA